MGAAEELRLVSPAGAAAALQTRPLARWDDGSVRWLDCQGLVNEAGAHRVEKGGARLCCKPVQVTEGDGEITLDNGIVAITLAAAGPSPIASVRYMTREVAADLPFEAGVKLADGSCHSSAGEEQRELALHLAGPVRSVVDVRGRHLSESGGQALSYRLRVEVVAGLPLVVLRYWLLHLDPGEEYRHLSGVRFSTRWKTPSPARRFVHQTRHSIMSVQREVETDLPVDIHVGPDHPKVRVDNYECLKDDTDYPEYLYPPLDDSKPCLGLALNGGGSVTAWVDEFAALMPKGLSSDADDITLHLWPEWADATAMHQGWSREMTMRLVFSEADGHPGLERVKAVADASQDTGRARLPAEWYAARKCWMMETVLPASGEKTHAGASAFLILLCGLPTPMGMWDYGDTMAPGYTTTYSYVGRNARLPGMPPQRFYVGGNSYGYCQENLLLNEPVWMNNEYDVIICFARECMRGGSTPELWQKSAAFVRHNIEIDFIHYSDHRYMHHGSPAHSVNHCMASAYPSHMWCEGLLAWYCISGDDDVLDVAVMMGDYIVGLFRDPGFRGKSWKFSRELGWALLYLSCVADITREQRFFDMADELARTLTAHPRDDALTKQMITYAFGYSSIALGAEMLHRCTGEQYLHDWLVQLADDILRLHRDEGIGIGGSSMNYFNAAYALTSDAKYVTGICEPADVLAEAKGEWKWPYTKQTAQRYRPYSRLWKSALDCLTSGSHGK